MKRTLFAAAVATLALGTASVYAADANVPQPSVYFEHQQVNTNADRNAERANTEAQTQRQSATAGSSANAANDDNASATLNDSFHYPY